MTESKTELLGWLNDLLSLNYTSVEQCGTGAAFCQILDSIYGTVPMSRVKFNSKSDYDHVNNFKILQAVFVKHNIVRNVPIDRLVKCRYADNLEFLQWIKKYWDAFYPGGGYNATARRRQTDWKPETPKPKSENVKSKSAGQFLDTTAKRPASPSVNHNHIRGGSADSARGRERSPSAQETGHPTRAESLIRGRPPLAQKSVSQSLPASASFLDDTQTSLENERIISELKRQLSELRVTSDTLERERNFYYLKLRDLEVLMLEGREQQKDSVFLQEMQTILYATEEGFVRPKRNVPPMQLITSFSPSAITPINVAPPRGSLAALQSPLRTAPPVLISNTAPVVYAVSSSARKSSLSLLVGTESFSTSGAKVNEALTDARGEGSPEAQSADTEMATPTSADRANPYVDMPPHAAPSASRPDLQVAESRTTPEKRMSASRPSSASVPNHSRPLSPLSRPPISGPSRETSRASVTNVPMSSRPSSGRVSAADEGKKRSAPGTRPASAKSEAVVVPTASASEFVEGIVENQLSTDKAESPRLASAESIPASERLQQRASSLKQSRPTSAAKRADPEVAGKLSDPPALPVLEKVTNEGEAQLNAVVEV